jgi:transcriptional regulator with XRE-family HTH domain
MERAGARLKRVREKLGLTYRQVERASQEIAARCRNDEYAIALSRLADIENKGTIPSIFRLFSLCAIYRLDFNKTLRWYGVDIEALASEAIRIPLANTHPMQCNSSGPILVPQESTKESDLTRTTFLGQFLRRWGKNGLALLNGAEARQYGYGVIGRDDWSMYPVLHPGSLVLIDEARRKIAAGGWSSEVERPLYFVEHRHGYRCGWCSFHGDSLLIHSHPSSQVQTEILAPGEFDVIGQVTGVAMRFESQRRHSARSQSGSTESPGL